MSVIFLQKRTHFLRTEAHYSQEFYKLQNTFIVVEIELIFFFSKIKLRQIQDGLNFVKKMKFPEVQSMTKPAGANPENFGGGMKFRIRLNVN